MGGSASKTVIGPSCCTVLLLYYTRADDRACARQNVYYRYYVLYL